MSGIILSFVGSGAAVGIVSDGAFSGAPLSDLSFGG